MNQYQDLFNFVHDKLKNGCTYQEVPQWLKTHPQYSIEDFFSVLTLMKHGTLTDELFRSEVSEFRKGYGLQMEIENERVYGKSSLLFLNIKKELGLKEEFTQAEIEEFKKLPQNGQGQTWSPTFKFAGTVQKEANRQELFLKLKALLETINFKPSPVQPPH